MEKDLLENAILQGLKDSDLHLSEIPDLDLYIDQILTLVAAKNASASARYQDNVLTKTMINNYSKEGLLMPVKGKKYTKEHIVQMLLIYSLKNSLSIGDIHRVLEGARGEGAKGEELMRCYEKHLEEKERVKKLAAKSVKTMYDSVGEDGSEFLVSLLGLLSYSSYLRNIALELLEARYPSVSDEKEKEKKSEKEKKEKDKDKDKKSSAEKAEADVSEGEKTK